MEEEKKDKGEKRKKSKVHVKAYCGKCFQFFRNSPFSKICKAHLEKGKCNIYECKKNSENCVRKFSNLNSENRHTYCLCDDEIQEWDKEKELQTCLGVKRSSDVNLRKKSINLENKQYLSFPNLFKESSNKSKSPKQSEKSLDMSNNFKYNSLGNLIDDISKLNFYERDDNFFFDDALLIEEKTRNINLSNNEIQQNIEQNHAESFSYSTPQKTKNCVSVSKKIKDEDNLDLIFGVIQEQTKVSKSSLNKLKSALKKKGILTAKILRLYKSKHKSFDFMIQEFKDVCNQVKTIAMSFETIL